MPTTRVIVLNPIKQSPASFVSMQAFAGKLQDALKQIPGKNVFTVSELCSAHNVCDDPSPNASQKREAIHAHAKIEQVSYVFSFSTMKQGSGTSGLVIEYNPQRDGAFDDAGLLYGLIAKNAPHPAAVQGTRNERGHHIMAAEGMGKFLYDAAQLLSAYFGDSVHEFDRAYSDIDRAVQMYEKGTHHVRFDYLIGQALLLAGVHGKQASMITALATNYGTGATLYVKDSEGIFIPSLTINLYNEFNPEERRMFEASQQSYITAITQFVRQKFTSTD